VSRSPRARGPPRPTEARLQELDHVALGLPEAVLSAAAAARQDRPTRQGDQSELMAAATQFVKNPHHRIQVPATRGSVGEDPRHRLRSTRECRVMCRTLRGRRSRGIGSIADSFVGFSPSRARAPCGWRRSHGRTRPSPPQDPPCAPPKSGRDRSDPTRRRLAISASRVADEVERVGDPVGFGQFRCCSGGELRDNRAAVEPRVLA
jgi:hypothetical protein